jgi:hypothetical protein
MKKRAYVQRVGLVIGVYKNVAFTFPLASKLVAPGNTYFAVAAATASTPETPAPDWESTGSSA